MDGFKRYLFTGILTWIIVDFTTAFNPDIRRWLEHMPLIWAFYIGYPLVFANLIYTRGWDDRRIFYAMIAGAFFIEIVCSGNTLLYTFPIMVVMIPVAVAIYTIVTFLPKWITDGDLQGRRRTLAILGLVYLTVAFLNYRSNLGA
jgi:hypothetical protein